MTKTAALALVLLAPSAWAQFATGNVYGNVTDESGAVLPAATVSLTGATIGPAAPRREAGATSAS